MSKLYDGDEVLIPTFELAVPKRIVVLAFELISEFPSVVNSPITSVLPPT